MKYSASILLFLLFSSVSAVNYINPTEVKPEKTYVIVTEKDGKLYAVDVGKHDHPETNEISEDRIGNVEKDNNLRWRFLFGIPKFDPHMVQPPMPSGRIVSVGSGDLFGMVSTGYLNNKIRFGEFAAQGYAADRGDGSIYMMFPTGRSHMALHGNVDPDNSTVWRIAETTGKYVNPRTSVSPYERKLPHGRET